MLPALLPKRENAVIDNILSTEKTVTDTSRTKFMVESILQQYKHCTLVIKSENEPIRVLVSWVRVVRGLG